MPVYEYYCRQCGYKFDKFLRTIEVSEVRCPSCQSPDVERLLSPVLFRMGRSTEPSSEFSAKEAEVSYYKEKKDYDRAAKAAEKAGKSDWEIKDLYRKTGKKV